MGFFDYVKSFFVEDKSKEKQKVIDFLKSNGYSDNIIKDLTDNYSSIKQVIQILKLKIKVKQVTEGCYFFTGVKGSGKTSLIMNFLDNNYDIGTLVYSNKETNKIERDKIDSFCLDKGINIVFTDKINEFIEEIKDNEIYLFDINENLIDKTINKLKNKNIKTHKILVLDITKNVISQIDKKENITGVVLNTFKCNNLKVIGEHLSYILNEDKYIYNNIDDSKTKTFINIDLNRVIST